MYRKENKIKKYFCFVSLFLSMLLSIRSDAIRESIFWNREVDPFCHVNKMVINEKHYQGYHVKVSTANEGLCHSIDIEKEGQLLFHDEEIGGHFFLNKRFEDKGSPFFSIKKSNIHLVFSKWTGGAHCCFSLRIFSLNDGFRKVASIDGGNSVPTFKDLDGDGISEIEVLDDFLAYRFSSFASSAFGSVILKYSNGHYRVAAELMRKPPPNMTRWKSEIKSWKNKLRHKQEPDWPPPSLIQTMTDLIFTGNKQIAFYFISSIWPSGVSGKNDFLSAYEEALQQSNFYLEFEKQLRSNVGEFKE